MKSKLLLVALVGLLLISCGKKEEVKPPNEEEVVVEEQVIDQGDATSEQAIEVKEDENPLSEYVSDEVYENGREIFYGESENADMFAEDKEQFSGNYEDFKAYVESNFEPTMLITQNGVNSAVVYFSDGESTKRIIIKGSRVIEKDGSKYYINVFKDRVEIKKGKNGRVVPLYLRGR